MVKETCSKCGDETRDPWREVVGYERKRPGGGTNHVALRKTTGKVVCGGCMALLRGGHDPGQMTI